MFAEQCYQKRDMLRSKHGRKAQAKERAGGIEIRPLSTSKRAVKPVKEVKD